jgi:uncharacterized membrane protein
MRLVRVFMHLVDLPGNLAVGARGHVRHCGRVRDAGADARWHVDTVVIIIIIIIIIIVVIVIDADCNQHVSTESARHCGTVACAIARRRAARGEESDTAGALVVHQVRCAPPVVSGCRRDRARAQHGLLHHVCRRRHFGGERRVDCRHGFDVEQRQSHGTCVCVCTTSSLRRRHHSMRRVPARHRSHPPRWSSACADSRPTSSTYRCAAAACLRARCRVVITVCLCVCLLTRTNRASACCI